MERTRTLGCGNKSAGEGTTAMGTDPDGLVRYAFQFTFPLLHAPTLQLVALSLNA
jgi:hypothetical protein